MEASLYVHVPFCSGAKCDYCDFYSVPVKSGDPRPERFAGTILSQAGVLFDTFKASVIPTLYIGGGTPSVLGAAGINRLVRGLLELISRFSPSPAEVTVEANPESADEAFLAALREAGATRLSFGLQTFYEPSRLAVNRNTAGRNTVRRNVSDEALLTGRLSLAALYFPGAFSADLMAGLPFQNEKTLLDDIDTLLGYKPAHISFYALSLEPETPLAKAASEKAWREKNRFPEQDEADRLWLTGRDALEKAGYSQYEVSNFCSDGRESGHNIRYWLMKNWLALGPSASGTLIDDANGTGLRYTVPRSPMPGFLVEELDTLTLMKETFLMGFRYIHGPDEDLFRLRFKKGINDFIPGTLDAWRRRGLLQNDRIALTKEGLLFLDPFLVDVFSELDSAPH